jgi:hypothetical protein
MLTNFRVATFTHANGVEPANAFTATINWGDGTTSAGTITLSGTTYGVTGSHTYTSTGSHTITTSVTEVAGSGGIKLHDNLGGRAALPPDTSSTSGASLAEPWLAALTAQPWPEQRGTPWASEMPVVAPSLSSSLAAGGAGVTVPGAASGQPGSEVDATSGTLTDGNADIAISDLYFSRLAPFDTPADPDGMKGDGTFLLDL